MISIITINQWTKQMSECGICRCFKSFYPSHSLRTSVLYPSPSWHCVGVAKFCHQHVCFLKELFLPAAKRQVKCWGGLLFFFRRRRLSKKSDSLLFCFLVHCSFIIGVVFRYFDLYHYFFSLMCVSFQLFPLISISFY